MRRPGTRDRRSIATKRRRIARARELNASRREFDFPDTDLAASLQLRPTLIDQSSVGECPCAVTLEFADRLRGVSGSRFRSPKPLEQAVSAPAAAVEKIFRYGGPRRLLSGTAFSVPYGRCHSPSTRRRAGSSRAPTRTRRPASTAEHTLVAQITQRNRTLNGQTCALLLAQSHSLTSLS
jgi:hypothetical protein